MSVVIGNGHLPSEVATAAEAYLVARGFEPDVIERVGWRIEPIGTRCRRYGLPPGAAEVLVWVIPYRHPNGHVTFERIRFISQRDLDTYGGGKYRGPAGRSLALYDPLGALADGAGPLDSLLVIEGEANTVAAFVACPELPVVGLPGQNLTVEMAADLGHVPVVFLWIDRHDQAAEANATRIAERLTSAGVEEVRLLPAAAGLDANDALRELGAERAGSTLREMLDQATPIGTPDVQTAPASSSPLTGWPDSLQPAALHGLAGEVVATVGPHSEADPAALLLQFLAAFGNAAGRGPGFRAEADFHATNLFVLLVGQTAKGRKGSSWGQVARIFERADPAWREERVKSGASSGEGLIWAVRDPTLTPVPLKEKGKVVGHEDQETDPGVSDKRLLDVESEFASVLRNMCRTGNILSVTIRKAWDSGELETLTKQSSARARGAHISIIGHVTSEELRRELDATESANGFANRFLFVCVKRSKALPEGGNLREADLDRLADQTREALRFASTIAEIRRDEGAKRLWAEVYEELSDGKPGLFGAVTSRSEAQVMRLACLYALLDGSEVVRTEHLEAALALWSYCEQSARHIFGSALGDPLADEALEALRGAPGQELTRTELRDRFARHKKGAEIERALGQVERAGLAVRHRRPSGGAPIEVWRAL